MAKYTLFCYDGPHFGKVMGVANTLTSAKKKAYKLNMDYKDYVDILETGYGDIRTWRTIASIYTLDTGVTCYASHSTDKVGVLTPNGAVRNWSDGHYISFVRSRKG